MNTLIINTAFEEANYILLKDDEIFEITTDSNAKHSETSLKKIDQLLQSNNLSINDIDVICGNIGPGSFTGIRIGIAILKGLCCGNNKIKVIPFDSFEPIALDNKEIKNICIKASNDDYYVGLNKSGKIEKHLVMLNEEIEQLDSKIIFQGSYTISQLANLIKSKIQENKFATLNDCNPLYLKLSQAEQELKKKENNKCG